MEVGTLDTGSERQKSTIILLFMKLNKRHVWKKKEKTFLEVRTPCLRDLRNNILEIGH